MSQQVITALRELERSNGRLLPADVVRSAENPESPLHGHFEWDDTAAGAKYRLLQARALIRSVKIDITVHSVPMSVVGYVRDPELQTKDSGYRNVMQLRTEEDAARAAVIDEMKRVSNAVRRAKSVAAVLGFVEDIDRIEDLARGVIERADARPQASA